MPSRPGSSDCRDWPRLRTVARALASFAHVQSAGKWPQQERQIQGKRKTGTQFEIACRFSRKARYIAQNPLTRFVKSYSGLLLTGSRRREAGYSHRLRARQSGDEPRDILSHEYAKLDKRRDAGDALADHQLVNVVGAFVGVDAFEIVHVAHDAVIVDDDVGAENVARFACGFERDADVVHFQHGNVRWIDFVLVF